MEASREAADFVRAGAEGYGCGRRGRGCAARQRRRTCTPRPRLHWACRASALFTRKGSMCSSAVRRADLLRSSRSGCGAGVGQGSRRIGTACGSRSEPGIGIRLSLLGLGPQASRISRLTSRPLANRRRPSARRAGSAGRHSRRSGEVPAPALHARAAYGRAESPVRARRRKPWPTVRAPTISAAVRSSCQARADYVA